MRLVYLLNMLSSLNKDIIILLLLLLLVHELSCNITNISFYRYLYMYGLAY